MEAKQQKHFKTFGWLAFAACGLCCALPIIGATVGIGAITALGAYLEKIAIVVMGISGILFALYFYNKSKAKKACAPSCETNCDCKPDDKKLGR
jgi:drug/metabolite transporter (DMT)-like permease